MELSVPVVGGINIDIGGKSFAPLIGKDSNPGKVNISFGGVGRNIAHNICLLGIRTGMLTAVGEDAFMRNIAESCRLNGIDISRALIIPGGMTSVYLYINDNSGDMALAVADMEICEKITPEYLAVHLEFLNSAPLVIADANIPEVSVRWLTEHCRTPIFADCVSTKKAEKLRCSLGKIHTLKANRLEAELLSQIVIRDESSLQAAARRLLDTGLKRVFISLGSKGVLAYDGKQMLRESCYPAKVRNAGGAGDAFMAALVPCYLQGLSLADTCRFASAAASLATESEETINPAMSAEAVYKRAEQMPDVILLS